MNDSARVGIRVRWSDVLMAVNEGFMMNECRLNRGIRLLCRRKRTSSSAEADGIRNVRALLMRILSMLRQGQAFFD